MGYVNMPEAMYSVKQCAAILKISRQALYQGIKAGRVNASVDEVNQLRISVPETYRLLMNGFGQKD